MLIIKNKKIINLNNVTHTCFSVSYERLKDTDKTNYIIKLFFSSYDKFEQRQEFTFFSYDNEKDREDDLNKIISAYDAGYKILYL